MVLCKLTRFALCLCLLRPQGQRTLSFHGRQRQRNPRQCHLSNVGLRWWGFRWNLWRCQGLYQQSTEERHEVKLDLLAALCVFALSRSCLSCSPLCISPGPQHLWPYFIRSCACPCAALDFIRRVRGLNGALELFVLFPPLGRGAPGAFVWPLWSPLFRDKHSCVTCSVLCEWVAVLPCVTFKCGTSE